MTDLNAVREDTEKLEDSFAEIAKETYYIMEQNEVNGVHLINLSRRRHQEFDWPEIVNTTKVIDIWPKLSFSFDFLNYTLLEQLINEFGNEALIKCMRDYKVTLQTFRNSTRLCDFAHLLKDVNQSLLQSDLKGMVIILDKNWEECTLEDMENWREHIAQKLSLPLYVMTLKDIDSAMSTNVSVTWVVSAPVMVSVAESMSTMDLSDFYKEHGIISMSFDGEEYECQSQAEKMLVNFDPIMSAAMQTIAGADIVPEVFDWIQHTRCPLPTTIAKVYSAFTSKLLMKHLLGHSVDTEKSWNGISLKELAPDTKWVLHNLCKVAWEGIVRQQLSYGINDVGRDTLGLMREVRSEDGQLSYHFIYLSLQEFLSAYYITQLPMDKQKEVIQKHLTMKHLNIVIRFYFGLTEPNEFNLKLITEHLSQDERAAIHWMFELGDVKTVTKELESRNIHRVDVELSYSWIPLDYCVLSFCMSYYPIQWRLFFESTITGDEQMEVLSKGIVSISKTAWKGEIFGQFSDCSITLKGMKWFVNIQLRFLRKIVELDFSFNKLNDDALNIFCEVIPNLNKLQVLYFSGNPVGNGGAVAALQNLRHNKSLLNELDLRNTGVGEKDCAELTLLMSNTNMEVLDVSDNNLSSSSVDSIIKGLLLNNNTMQTLKLSNSCLSDENCFLLSSFLQRKVCQVRWLDLCNCNIGSKGASYLALSLNYNYSLTTLEMSHNPIGDVGATAFGLIFKTNTVLTELCIDCCEITSNGSVEIAEGLRENTKLEILLANGNQFGLEGAKSMSKAIEHNRTLQQLYLHGDNSLEEEDEVQLLLTGLKKNRTLLRLNLPKKYKLIVTEERVVWS